MNFPPLAVLFMVAAFAALAGAQEYGPPDRGQPGDAMIQAYLQRQAERIHQTMADDLRSPEEWQSRLPQYREEYLYMLGLWPLPEKTPLKATVTGTLEGDGFTVEMLHYQSRPGLYVTGNLYRPREVKPGERLPAVFYPCGHSGRGRNGNKTAFQPHGMWFARHGYICLLVDSLQLGEIAAIHHGTYREGRWWWHARGYTPAGVECWNGVRGIDYLTSRSDVDSERIAVTGISGGGAATFWIAAADERVKVAVPVSGMADLPSYVSNRVINGHCDCMFLYNTFQWPWTRIAALVAPRPLLFSNSDQDRIFPMDANDRIINRLERVYRLYGAGDRVDAVVSMGGHAYRQDLRESAYRFINTYLKGDPRPIADSEVDLSPETQRDPPHPIPPERLRVFPTDADLPADELNTTIDQHFVALAKPSMPAKGEFATWKKNLLAELRRVTFRALPERVPAAERVGDAPQRLRTEDGIALALPAAVEQPGDGGRVILAVRNLDDADDALDWLKERTSSADRIVAFDPRGVGASRWTRTDPPNYVARSHVLLGTTVDTGRVRDVAAAARWLKQQTGKPVHAAGRGPAGLLAAYAAVLEPDIDGVLALDPPRTHSDAAAPQFLNLLRVCDAPDMLGLLAPRPLTIVSRTGDDAWERVAAIYQAADARGHLSVTTTAR